MAAVTLAAKLQQLAKADAPASPLQIDSASSLAAISSRSMGSYGSSPYEETYQPPTSPDDQAAIAQSLQRRDAIKLELQAANEQLAHWQQLVAQQLEPEEPVLIDEDDGALSELQAKESELQDHLIFRQLMDLVLKQLNQETAKSKLSTEKIKRQLRARRAKHKAHAPPASAPSSPGRHLELRSSELGINDDEVLGESVEDMNQIEMEQAVEEAAERVQALEESVRSNDTQVEALKQQLLEVEQQHKAALTNSKRSASKEGACDVKDRMLELQDRLEHASARKEQLEHDIGQTDRDLNISCAAIARYRGELDDLRQAASVIQDKENELEAIRVENAALQLKLQELTSECKKKEEAMSMLTNANKLEGSSVTKF